jgi:4-diphosphocytidyl-2-C-methyl-D-erythritol kinase
MFAAFAEFAPAKINLALHVLGRRLDGYHEIDSIAAFADVGDELVFSAADAFALTADGPFATLLPPPENNIIATAYRQALEIAAARGRKLPPVAVHLTKNLPVSAGIGGGSADAAAALRGFLKIAGIEPLDDAIAAAALMLGADVPVCLIGKACRMQGVGERVTPLDNFKPLHAVLVNPRVEVPTAAVFGKLGLEPGESSRTPIADTTNPSAWRNDLMVPAIALAPVIAEVLTVLESRHGMTAARMSGSGATCFGVFEDGVSATAAVRAINLYHPRWWARQVILA